MYVVGEKVLENHLNNSTNSYKQDKGVNLNGRPLSIEHQDHYNEKKFFSLK